jgi:C-lobe and N-lobe beta barrels of Tf-binding protein B
MQAKLLTALTALSLTLSACGGSEGGIASTPAPIPAPTPTPTPSPTTTPTAWTPPVSVAVTPTETFSALTISTATQQAAGAAAHTANSSDSSGMVGIGRDAQGGYSLTVPWLEASTLGINAIGRRFDFQAASQNTTGSGYANGTYYVRQSNSSTNAYDHSLEVSPSTDPNVKVATLISCNLPGAESCNNEWSRTFVVFGNATPFAEIPLTGTAGYSGSFGASDMQDLAGLGGKIDLQVDFSTKGVTGTLNSITAYEGYSMNGSQGPLPNFTLAGQLGTNGLLGGTLTPSGDFGFGMGGWQAGFFGPNAVSIGGTMYFDVGASGTYTGTFSATKN